MIKTIKFEGESYPYFQTLGHAAQFAIPFARHLCTGNGYDIGCMRKEWSFPGAIPIDLAFDDGWDAYNLPGGEMDYIFSSHCLEHLPDWVKALEYWHSRLKPGGVLFLYLPHWNQKYWRPWNNRKHFHSFSPELISTYISEGLNMKNVFSSDRDLNDSFCVAGEKSL